MEKCPFCGAEIKVVKGVLGTIMFICNSCGADVAFIGADDDLNKAIDAWNRRYTPSEQERWLEGK